MSTHSEAAKSIRKELKEAFKNTKFSVRSDSFSGGNAVRINWVDGPITKEVNEIVNKYQYGSFNGMEDIYEYNNSNPDLPQVKYVQTQRKISYESKVKIAEKIKDEYGIEIKITKGFYSDGEVYAKSEDFWIENFRCYSGNLIHRVGSDMNL